MSKLLRTKAAISLFGSERMDCKFYQFVAPEKMAETELITLLIKEQQEHFGVHLFGKFIGPFEPNDYQIGNFIPLGEGLVLSHLMNFYTNLSPVYTKTDISDSQVRIVDYLALLVNTYSKFKGNYYVFKYNYLDRKETVAFGKEQHQFNYYYLFLFVESQRISVGYLWYD